MDLGFCGSVGSWPGFHICYDSVHIVRLVSCSKTLLTLLKLPRRLLFWLGMVVGDRILEHCVQDVG